MVVLFLDVHDQLTVLAEASRLSLSSSHAFFSFSPTPYDVTLQSLLATPTSVLTQDRFSNYDATTGNSTIFSSVFVISCVFPRINNQSSNSSTNSPLSRTKRSPEEVDNSLYFQPNSEATYKTFRDDQTPPWFHSLRFKNHSEYLISKLVDLTTYVIGLFLNIDMSRSSHNSTPAASTSYSKPKLRDISSSEPESPPKQRVLSATHNNEFLVSDVGQHPRSKRFRQTLSSAKSYKIQSSAKSYIQRTSRRRSNSVLYFQSEDTLEDSPAHSRRYRRELQHFTASDADLSAVYDVISLIALAAQRAVQSGQGHVPVGKDLVASLSDLSLLGKLGRLTLDPEQRVVYDFELRTFNSSVKHFRPWVNFTATGSETWSPGGRMAELEGLPAPDECFKKENNCKHGREL